MVEILLQRRNPLALPSLAGLALLFGWEDPIRLLGGSASITQQRYPRTALSDQPCRNENAPDVGYRHNGAPKQSARGQTLDERESIMSQKPATSSPLRSATPVLAVAGCALTLAGITLSLSPALAAKQAASASQATRMSRGVTVTDATTNGALRLVAPPHPKVFFIPGTEKITAVSGKAGLGKKSRLGQPPGLWSNGLTTIKIGESHDEPCHVFAGVDALNSNARQSPAMGYQWGCTIIGSSKSISFTGTRYVHAIKVCDNGKTSGKTRYRIKGLKVWSAAIDRNTGKVLKEDATPSEWKLANCKTWRTKVACGADKVARSLQVHDNGHGGASGLALQCAKIELRARN